MNALEIYEMELRVYEIALANYEKACFENPQIAHLLHKPEAPTLRAYNPHWHMRNVVTASRRKWK